MRRGADSARVGRRGNLTTVRGFRDVHRQGSCRVASRPSSAAASGGFLESSPHRRSTRLSPNSAASSAIASVIAARKSATAGKRTPLPAANGRRQIPPIQGLAPETRVFIGFAEGDRVSGLPLSPPHHFGEFPRKIARTIESLILAPTAVPRHDLLSNSADSSARKSRVPFSSGIFLEAARRLCGVPALPVDSDTGLRPRTADFLGEM